MNKQRLGLIGAVALVALGTLVLVRYVSSAEDRALAGEELVEVLVVSAKVPAGTPVNELQSKLRIEAVPIKVRASGALASIGEAEEMVVAVDLVPGEQLTAARLVPATEFAVKQNRVGRGGGTVVVPEGLLEITIPVDAIRTIGGTVRPGDYVGVLTSFTVPGAGEAPPVETTTFLLHKTLVTNVQGVPVADPGLAATSAERGPIPEGGFLVTLAVDAASAQKLVFSSSYGDIWLALEPIDAPEEGAGKLTLEALMGA